MSGKPTGSGRDANLAARIPGEDECATCYHGVSMHVFASDGVALEERCTVPGCGCKEFMEPEYDDA